MLAGDNCIVALVISFYISGLGNCGKVQGSADSDFEWQALVFFSIFADCHSYVSDGGTVLKAHNIQSDPSLHLIETL